MSRYLNSPREADWYACPFCGHDVKVGVAHCRKCQALGSVSQATDSPDAAADESEEEFDYEDWKKREFGRAAKYKPHHLPWKYWLAGLVLIISLFWGMMRHY